MKVEFGAALPSLARVGTSDRPHVRVAAVQVAWHGSKAAQADVLREAAALAHAEGARILALSELTLYPYVCFDARGPVGSAWQPEAFESGDTMVLARELASQHHLTVIASTYEHNEGGLGFNTAFAVASDGSLVMKQRKTHLPVTAGYYEDKWFARNSEPGVSIGDAEGVAFGVPTCWDQWFPEWARAHALAGAELLIYPTAIGSEPDFPAFDTAPLWRHTMVAHGIANGVFVVAANRVGAEGPLTFYGSSFVSDPYGRVLVEADRTSEAVIVADLDLDSCKDWIELFPFFKTRRPDFYGALTTTVGA